MSYGYGLSASLFQIAHAYTVFAHDGELIPVTLTRPLGSGAATPVSGIRILSPKTASTVRDMLHLVTLPGGTAPKAQVVGYSVGGKSGTAYKHAGRGYDKSKYRASFVGMAPMPNPRIVVAVSVDEPTAGSHFGGAVSGPVFSGIVGDTLRTLNVPPDMPVKQLVVEDNGAAAASAPAAANAPVKHAANAPANKSPVAARHMTVADNTKNRPGVVR